MGNISIQQSIIKEIIATIVLALIFTILIVGIGPYFMTQDSINRACFDFKTEQVQSSWNIINGGVWDCPEPFWDSRQQDEMRADEMIPFTDDTYFDSWVLENGTNWDTEYTIIFNCNVTRNESTSTMILFHTDDWEYNYTTKDVCELVEVRSA